MGNGARRLGFYQAAAYHQNYIARHPSVRYVVANDLPKLAKLQAKFPDMYSSFHWFLSNISDYLIIISPINLCRRCLSYGTLHVACFPVGVRLRFFIVN